MRSALEAFEGYPMLHQLMQQMLVEKSLVNEGFCEKLSQTMATDLGTKQKGPEDKSKEGRKGEKTLPLTRISREELKSKLGEHSILVQLKKKTMMVQQTSLYNIVMKDVQAFRNTMRELYASKDFENELPLIFEFTGLTPHSDEQRMLLFNTANFSLILFVTGDVDMTLGVFKDEELSEEFLTIVKKAIMMTKNNKGKCLTEVNEY